MRSAVLLALLTVAGCSIGGGPTFGYRGGKPTVGWEAGTGVMYSSNDPDMVRADVGQSYRGGKVYSYAGLTGTQAVGDELSGYSGAALGGGFGGGSDGDGAMLSASMFTTQVESKGNGADRCTDDYWAVTVSVGARFVAGEPEVYVAPRIDSLSLPCY